jgi:hypothetical protein
MGGGAAPDHVDDRQCDRAEGRFGQILHRLGEKSSTHAMAPAPISPEIWVRPPI